MFTCPHCQATLVRVEGPHGISWSCPRCGGRAAGLGLLLRTPVRDYVSRAWVLARLRSDAGGRLCPVCTGPMVEIPSLPDYVSPTLDICRRCHLFWFDPSEFEQVPAVARITDAGAAIHLGAAGSGEEALPEKAAEILAVHRAQAETASLESAAWATAGPDAWWQWIPGILGFPVELEHSLLGMPWATWSLAALITAVSIAALFDLQWAVNAFGLIPAKVDRFYGLTVITSFLLHGGILHLVGNMYYLLIFGDNVEDYLGHGRFLVLVALAALIGAIAHVALDPRSEVPVIGASGGISGLLAFYGLRFPRARMGFLLGWYFRWVRVPALGFLAFWLVLQGLTAWQQIAGLTSVSALAHLGGAAVGVWFWLVWREGSPRHV